MKKFASALVLLTGLTLLAGCDAVQSWLPVSVNHRPEVKIASVTGFVEDSAGNVLTGAMVSNGASVTFTDSTGAFTLTNVRTGVQYITATYDNVKSSPVEIEVKSGANTVSKIVVGTVGPVSDLQNPVKFVQILPDTLTASYSIDFATDSVDATPSYSSTRYSAGKDVQISLASPPNGAGLIIASYRVTYDATGVATFSADFSPTMRVEPGGVTESGPNKNLTIKNVGPISSAFSEALHKSESGLIEATITLYIADKDNQTTESQVPMHTPDSTDRDRSIPFRAKVYIQRSEQ